VVIGRNWQIVSRGQFSDLLLPQAAPEWGFEKSFQESGCGTV
jgi:hypothetical protein